MGTTVAGLVVTDEQVITFVVPTGELARILHDHQDARAAYELWKAAIDAGGQDNVTLAVTHWSTGREAAG
jgi:hypothetical protein